MSQEPCDQHLIQQFLAGDPEGLGLLYDRYGQDVFRFLQGFVDFSTAEDLLQETFLKAGEKLSSYSEQGRLLPWLLTIARRKAIDHLRRDKRHRVRGFGEQEAEMVQGREAMPDQRQEEQEVRSAIGNAIDTLPETQRVIFLMREEANLTFKEISQSLNIPLNTALSHMHRAIKGLRNQLVDLVEPQPTA
ncbi:MAG: RNA polymerase sigma factor [Planctomycetota bacterium]|jgi:RNA polymerase sigma-70 factor (ECF subfamily)